LAKGTGWNKGELMPRRRRGFEGCAQVFYFARTPAVKKSPGLPDYKPVSVPASVARERAAAIPLGRRLLSGSSDLPGSRNGADRSCSPIWSCSAWGLPCRPRCRGRGALLPHLFTLTGTGNRLRRYIFCGAFREIRFERIPPAVSRHAVLWRPDFPLPLAGATTHPAGPISI